MDEWACSKCKELKPIDQFHLDNSRTSGRKSQCKTCTSERVKKWRLANLEERREAERKHKRKYNQGTLLEHKYNITWEDYQQMLQNQGGVCKICKDPPSQRRLAVDHNHHTGEVRGLLCGRCNTALGSFKDNIELLKQALIYLESKVDDERPSFLRNRKQ